MRVQVTSGPACASRPRISGASVYISSQSPEMSGRACSGADAASSLIALSTANLCCLLALKPRSRGAMALRSAARAAAVRVTVGGLLKAAVSGRARTNMRADSWARSGKLHVLPTGRGDYFLLLPV